MRFLLWLAALVRAVLDPQTVPMDPDEFAAEALEEVEALADTFYFAETKADLAAGYRTAAAALEAKAQELEASAGL